MNGLTGNRGLTFGLSRQLRGPRRATYMRLRQRPETAPTPSRNESAWRARLCAILLVLFLADLLASPALAAKPTPPPAPTCASGLLGTPTFAFLWSYQLYVGNADGSCSVALASVAQQYPLAFAFDGTTYRVFWTADTRDEVKLISRMRWTIKMVEFTIAGGNISQGRPLPVRELWRDAVTTSQSSVGGLGVNSSASRLVFTRTYAGVTELKHIDLTSCTPTCAAPTTLLTPIYNPISTQFGRSGDDRLYYTQKSTDGTWWEIGLFENVSSALTGPIAIVDSNDPRYVGTRTGAARASRFFRGSFSPDDLVAFASVSGAAAIMDVIQLGPGCAQGLGLGLSCLASGHASIVAQDFPLDPLASSGPEWTPSGYLLRQIQGPSGTKRIETVDPLLPLPGAVLVDHGIGFLPAGLKQ